jgi:hypothetical protein
MLKDLIINRVLEELKKNKSVDQVPIELKGFVEIKAWKDGRLFYHDGGDNDVTIWAKHSLINLLSGRTYGRYGDQISTTSYKYSKPVINSASHDNSPNFINMDGMLLSGEQYFWDYTTFSNWVQPDWPAAAPYNYSYFPTKILFGTGYEFADWTAFQAAPGFPEYYTEYTTEELFEGVPGDCGIDDEYNYYSNIIGESKTLTQARTLSDISSEPLDTTDYTTNLGIDGAIKNCFAEQIYSANIYRKQETGGDVVYNTGTDTINPLYKGLGRPAYIYCKRNGSVRSSNSEVYISSGLTGDTAFDNRITYTCILPEQTGQTGANKFYPYNEHTLKEIGLFSDANFVINDTIPDSSVDPGWQQYNCMPGGIMLAKRNITPIAKTIDVRVSVSWTLYTA